MRGRNDQKRGDMKVYLEDIHYNTFMPMLETFNYVYSSGWLEDQVGYDIVNLEATIDEYNLTDGIHKVTAVKPDGNEIPSLLYFWHDERGQQHGFVCAVNDSQSQNYAKRRLETKASGI